MKNQFTDQFGGMVGVLWDKANFPTNIIDFLYDKFPNGDGGWRSTC